MEREHRHGAGYKKAPASKPGQTQEGDGLSRGARCGGCGAAAVDGVTDVHDLHVWTLVPGKDMATAHLTSSADSARVLESARAAVAKRVAAGGKLDPEALIDEVFHLNARSMIALCRHVVPLMRQQGGGCIVNLASISGQLATPHRAAYAASKGGVIALSKNAARWKSTLKVSTTPDKCRHRGQALPLPYCLSPNRAILFSR